MRALELAGGVYALPAEKGEANGGLIVGGEGSILVDCDARRLDQVLGCLAEIKAPPVRLLVNTHDNWDHASANNYFAEAGALVLATPACRDVLAASGQELAERLAEWGLAGKYPWREPALPQILPAGDLEIRWGGHRVLLRPVGHAHTPGDLVVYLPEEGVLFAGDTVFYRYHPVTRRADLGKWQRVLAEMEEWPVRWLVPGHGPVEQGGEPLRTLRAYFRDLLAEVGSLAEQGVPPEEMANHLELAAYRDWGKKNWLPVSAAVAAAYLRSVTTPAAPTA